MELSYSSLVFAIILICLLILIYHFYTFKDVDNVNDLVKLYNGVGIDPQATTLYQKESGEFVNIKYTSEEYKIVEEDNAYTEDGDLYRHKDHGEVTELENSFTISGITKKFTCPEPFNWNGSYCELPELCTSKKEYKGIPYEYSKLVYGSNRSDDTKYHQKMYLECPGSVLRLCPDDKVFAGVESLDTNGTPCVPYDICSINMDGYRHTTQIDDYVLQDNQFYICENGKSKLITCDEGLSFDEENNACTSPLCTNGERKANNSDSYYVCRNGVFRLVTCEDGVDETGTQCLIVEDDYCEGYEPSIVTYNDVYGGISTMTTCKNNEILTLNPDQEDFNLSFEIFTGENGESLGYCDNKFDESIITFNRYAFDEDGNQYDRIKDKIAFHTKNQGDGRIMIYKTKGTEIVETNEPDDSYVHLNSKYFVSLLQYTTLTDVMMSSRLISLPLDGITYRFYISSSSQHAFEISYMTSNTGISDRNWVVYTNKTGPEEFNIDCDEIVAPFVMYDHHLIPLICYYFIKGYAEDAFLTGSGNPVSSSEFKNSIKRYYSYSLKELQYFREDLNVREVTGDSSILSSEDISIDEMFPIISTTYIVNFGVVRSISEFRSMLSNSSVAIMYFSDSTLVDKCINNSLGVNSKGVAIYPETLFTFTKSYLDLTVVVAKLIDLDIDIACEQNESATNVNVTGVVALSMRISDTTSSNSTENGKVVYNGILYECDSYIESSSTIVLNNQFSIVF